MSRLPYTIVKKRSTISKSETVGELGRGEALVIYLELQTVLHVLLERFGNRLVKGAEDLHCELRVYALALDQVVERIRQSEPDAAKAYVSHDDLGCSKRQPWREARSTCSDGTARRMTVLQSP